MSAPVKQVAVGLDIGGTKIAAGLVDASGAIVYETTLPTMAAQRQVAAQAIRAAGQALAEAASRGLTVRGIGVGSAGQIDFAGGTVLAATDLLPGYGGTPLAALLQDAFGLPVVLDNDINALAVAEKTIGRGRGCAHFVCVALGTGVGGAVVADGVIVHGALGAAGELGHLSVKYDGPRCMCGNYGCLELYASGTGIMRMMRERWRGDAAAAPDSRQVAESWLAGDPEAALVMNETIAALATGLASLIHVLNPQLIVIGGGVADIGEPFLGPLREETKRRTMPALFAGVRIEPAVVGSKSGMIGAALQLWEYGSERTAP
ncbi:MAG: ROK family protein [Paenibacillaceae bacterium]|nr:ROK family protein [Paenibacillaceae bacterium]